MIAPNIKVRRILEKWPNLRFVRILGEIVPDHPADEANKKFKLRFPRVR